MIPRTVAVLSRWASAFPGTALPTTADALTLDQRFDLERRDPELLQLLSGAAPAELELQVLNGTWPEAAPTTQQRQDTERQQQIEQLLNATGGNPYGEQGVYLPNGEFQPGREPNLTAAMALEALDPERAAALKLQAFPPQAAPGALTEADAQRINAQLAAGAF